MSIEILLNVPADFVIPNDPQTAEEQQLAETMRSMRSIFTGDPQPGTRKFEGRKIIVAKVDATLDELEQAIAAFGYDWKVLGAKSDTMIRKPSEADVLDFMPDVAITDEEGNVTGYERPTHPRVGIYAGSIAWEYA